MDFRLESDPKLCLVCNKPIDLGTYHEDCMRCCYCGNEVGHSIIDRIIKDEERQAGENHKIMVYHQPCHDRKLEEDFQKSPVTITRAHLEMLTRAIQMFSPDLNLSIETNQTDACIHYRKFVHEMNLEEKFMHLKRMEAITAEAHIALSKDKQKIQVLLDERDRAKFAEADQFRKEQKEKKEEKQEKTREAARRIDPKERDKEKAIASLMKFACMSRADAIKNLGLPPETVQ